MPSLRIIPLGLLRQIPRRSDPHRTGQDDDTADPARPGGAEAPDAFVECQGEEHLSVEHAGCAGAGG